MRIKVNQSKNCALAIAVLLLAQLQPAFTQSVDQSSDSGIVAPSGGVGGDNLSFQADLYTGRFSYTLPIKVAPGRQGAEPKLALGYNSAGGNGWCGVGWSLEVGYIQRDNQKGVPIQWHQAYIVIPGGFGGRITNYLDYNLPSTQYDDSKGFIANFGGSSSTLVQVGPTNQNPLIYRQQVDTTFLTYKYYADNHWEVVDKGGNTFFFGEGITNQMENTNSGWVANSGSSTFRWAMDRVIDVNGNESFFQYTTDGGALYLTNITYNANTNSPALAATHEVDFILTNRTDRSISFLSGYRVQTQKRLSEIDIKAVGANVRKYILNYTNSPCTLRSLLTSVTEYGSDFTTALPPVTFTYQIKPFTFGPATNWNNLCSQQQTSAPWNCIRGVDGNSDTQVMMSDIDGDGLPDRVGRSTSSPYNVSYWGEINTGAQFNHLPFGFGGCTGYVLAGLDGQGQTGTSWNSPVSINGDGATIADLFDINGDGYPDRVMRMTASPYSNFYVQLNTGHTYSGNSGVSSNTFTAAVLWTNVDDFETANADWLSVRYKTVTDMIDMNGDGLPDRVSRKVHSPFDCFKVQFNTGAGFNRAALWQGLDSQGKTDSGWNGISAIDGNGRDYVILADINGDGLPDRVMKSVNSAYTNWVVQFNNGAGFEPAENWGPLDNQGNAGDSAWGAPVGSDGQNVWSTLVDINGDGLPDHVMRQQNLQFGIFSQQYWIVQLNTGSGFAPSILWKGLDGQGSTDASWFDISAKSSGDTYVDFFDINGDGLPDRVMRSKASPYDHLVVQLNQGPFPDLLNTVSNSLGGSVQASYIASTTLDNRNTNWVSDPWKEGTKSLLPFNVWVVSQVSSSDGMGNTSTKSYAFKGGYYNATEKEFRGFSQVTVTDSLGTQTTTYYHQSGGRDNTALGEYLDQGSESKMGIPFRTEVIGNDGKTNRIVLSKVEEVMLNSNGWYFPYVSQTITMNYEGLGTYRAKAEQFTYDTNTANVIKTCNLGEVTNVVFMNQSFTDIGNDSGYRQINYASLGNIKNRPSDIKISSDNAGNLKLREELLYYDSRGNPTNTQVWLDNPGTTNTTTSTAYDQYGNPIQATDAAGIVTTTVYDSTYQQYPVIQVTATFTNQTAYDARSGFTLVATDAKGLVASNSYDIFFRPTATYISTNAFGAPTLWKTKTSYSLGGVSGGISKNTVHKQVNDAVDTANGLESYVYIDGLGRPIQSRAEAEYGQFRVANTVYDKRGNVYFQTLPYFSSGTVFSVLTGNQLGTLTEFDSIGRAFRTTPAVLGTFANGSLQSTNATGGDIGSPVGPTTTAYLDGNNPWAIVVTDSEGKVKKTYADAYGRTISKTEVTAAGNFSTIYQYDLVGNLTNVIDSAGNNIAMVYDSLGRKTSMIDPDMGTWSYSYDNADRITQQIDARTNKITFSYSDQLGRLTSKQIYNSANSLVGKVTYTYDTSDDSNYTVFKGQLYKVTDLQGYQRSSYDVRGRVLKSTRFLNINAMEYVTQTTYDDADRVQQFTYPGNAATIQYSYDSAGNINQVKSLAGTGIQEIFLAPQGFNELGQLLSYTNGNGVCTTNIYYTNSRRPQRVWVYKGTNNLQDLSYTYDTTSDLKSINDGVYSNSASASLNNIVYDDLYRLTSLNSTARGTKAYGYNSIGNILTNQDFGSGLYQYGAKPHAVTGANGINYAYDACGNMTTRGSQTLTYDEQNELVRVSATNTLVNFGYADDGERLWRSGTNGYSIWIGSIYEINNGKVLCHVMVGGKRIATFEPQCTAGLAKVFGEQHWYVASITIQSVLDWPFQKGRGQMTMFAGTWMVILGFYLVARRKIRLKRYEIKKTFRPSFLWKQAVAFVFISALLWSSTGNVEAATYNPVFYYYHNNNLGSSNVLTDRSGGLVQHYEYASFGQTTYQDNDSAFPVSNRYTGQIFDDETGLYYYGARYYDAQLGRFTQADTVVQSPYNPQTLNRYSYCANNPLNCIDPSGHGFISGISHFLSSPLGMALGLAFGIDAIQGFLGPLIQQLVETAVGFAAGGAAEGIISANSKESLVAAAINGAEDGAASSIPVVGSVVEAALKGQDVGKAAIMAAISTVISTATSVISFGIIGPEIQSFADFVDYTVIQTASGAASGAANAAVNNKDIGKAALSGAEKGAEKAGIQLAQICGKWVGSELGIDKDLTSLGQTFKSDFGIGWGKVDWTAVGGGLQYNIKFSDPANWFGNNWAQKYEDPMHYLGKIESGAVGGIKTLLQTRAENAVGINVPKTTPMLGASYSHVGGMSPQMMGYGHPNTQAPDIDQPGGISLNVDHSGR